jgi:heme-degrading monooxygenase HmoA
MPAVTIDSDKDPKQHFRIDAFAVPGDARGEFESAMRRNLAFLQTIPGFLGHAVFEKADGPSAFNIITLAAWESRESMEGAGTRVRDYYESIGFDRAAALERWGVRAEIGNYSAQ